MIVAAYERLKVQYGVEPVFAELFTVDEQMEMWDRMIEESDERVDRLLSETMKHGN